MCYQSIPALDAPIPTEQFDINSLSCFGHSTTALSTTVNPPHDALWLNEATQMPFSFNPTLSIPKPLSPAMLALLEDLICQNTIGQPSSQLSISSGTAGTQTLLASPTLADISWDEGPITSDSYYQPRCEYASQRFAAQVCAFAQVGHTSFIHDSQVQNSAVLQEALSASALHAMRNASNNSVVRNFIHRRAALLVNAVDTVLLHCPSMQIDVLPPIQALLIYNCIRLFSMNDISQRSQAEQHELRLKTWVQILRRQLQPLRSNSTEWSRWVREESVRRTVLFAEMIIAAHAFLKQGWDRAEARLAPLSYTAHAALWEAKSAAEFERAWVTVPRREVRMVTLDRDLELVTPEESEELTVIFRVMHRGLDDARRWLGGDVTTLRRWGL